MLDKLRKRCQDWNQKSLNKTIKNWEEHATRNKFLVTFLIIIFLGMGFVILGISLKEQNPLMFMGSIIILVYGLALVIIIDDFIKKHLPKQN